MNNSLDWIETQPGYVWEAIGLRERRYFAIKSEKEKEKAEYKYKGAIRIGNNRFFPALKCGTFEQAKAVGQADHDFLCELQNTDAEHWRKAAIHFANVLMQYESTYDLPEHFKRLGRGDNRLRSDTYAQPRALRKGDVLITGDPIVKASSDDGGGSVQIFLEDCSLMVPARIPLALAPVKLGKAVTKELYLGELH